MYLHNAFHKIFKTVMVFLLCSWVGGEILGCAHGSKVAAPPSGEWRDKMQSMGKAITDLYPLLVSSQQFHASENREKIKKNLNILSDMAHEVNQERKRENLGNEVDKDPYMAIMSHVLDREIKLAADSFRIGKTEYSRTILRSATGMCIRCHSRGQWGPEFVDWEKESVFQHLKPIEKAELLSAVRHYDQAIQQYELVLGDSQLAMIPSEDWIKAAYSALNVAVRIKQDPQTAHKILSTILANKNLPEYQRKDAQDWEKSLVEWEKEEHKKKNKKDQNGLNNSLKKAEALIKDAHKKEDYWGDRSSYIQYLRASALLHDFLRVDVPIADQSQALYLLGLSYEAIAELLGGQESNEYYYKACIRRSPHTQIALNCYRRLEAVLNVDYLAPSGNIEIPRMALDQLRELRNMAQPIQLNSNSEGRGTFDRQ